AHDVVDARSRAQRIAGTSRHVREPTHHLHDLVERGAMLVRSGKEALEADVNEPRMLLRKRRVIETVFRHRAGTKILAYDICARAELARDVESFGGAKIDGDALLVAVEHRKETGTCAEQPARA